MDYIKKEFDGFNVYNENENNTFIHISIENEDGFYEELFDYFFSETKLLRFAENGKNVKFIAEKKNYIEIYKKLKIFLDEENEIDINEISNGNEELESVLENEYEIISKDEKKKIRLDKIGKIGEYIFTNFLYDYFKFDFILHKLNLVTDRNMNVYGIDTLFFSIKERMILFGESKVSKNIENGVKLINASLKTYEKQIQEEFELILSNNTINKNKDFENEFQNYIDMTISMNAFIKEAKINKIGIPIFITHGDTSDVNKIFSNLNKINKTKILNIDTVYICISMPIISKEKFVEKFTNYLSLKELNYGKQCK